VQEVRRTSLATIGQHIQARDPQGYYALLHRLAYLQANKPRKSPKRVAKAA
jgi:hypothetical protein